LRQVRVVRVGLLHFKRADELAAAVDDFLGPAREVYLRYKNPSGSK